MKSKKKIAALAAMGVLLLAGAAFGIYVSDYYKADDAALALATDPAQVERQGNFYILEPMGEPVAGLVFYPGGKVATEAYLPLLDRLRDRGVLCVLVDMPFHLAVFGKNRAGDAMAGFPDIASWYLGGHSLGGAMASAYLSDNPEAADGLILLGAYVYGEVNPARALTVYGSEDGILDRTKINYSLNVLVIPGGNHAYFGNYGAQKGDGEASVSREQQQEETVRAIFDFISGE